MSDESRPNQSYVVTRHTVVRVEARSAQEARQKAQVYLAMNNKKYVTEDTINVEKVR